MTSDASDTTDDDGKRRAGRVAADAPHSAQNFADGGLRLPQLAHRSGIPWPHSEQKRAPSGLSLSQFAQRIVACALDSDRFKRAPRQPDYEGDDAQAIRFFAHSASHRR
jgi:hypothetical protein